MAFDPSVDSQLVGIYGQGKAEQIRNYWAEFAPYRSNFLNQTPTFREAGGRKLLLINCPLQITPKGRAQPPRNPLTLGLLFTMQFPDSPPHCAVMLNQGERLVNEHPLVAQSGVVRLPLLPYLQELVTRPSLMDLLLACTAAFEEEYPVELPPPAGGGVMSGGGSGGVASPPPTAATGMSPVSSSSPGTVAANPNVNAAGAPPPRYVDPTASGASPSAGGSQSTASPPPTAAAARPEERELAEKVLLELKHKGDHHLKFKMQALVHVNDVKNHLKAQQEAEQKLLDRKEVLQATGPKMHEISELVGKWKSSNAMSSADSCIVPQNVLHGQMIELLAQNHAADDCMELLEKRLKKGHISSDDYLKSVQELSRKQFQSKLLLKRVMARVDCDAIARGLAKKFPNFDPVMVSEILKNSDYDVQAAEARLVDLASPGQ